MNYQELAEITGLKYSTARKYAMLLQEDGIIDEIDDSAVTLIKTIPILTDRGLTLKEALEKIAADKERLSGRDDFAVRLENLEEKMDTLADENRKLREIIESQKTEIHNLKGKKHLVPVRASDLVAKIDGPGAVRTIIEKTVDFFGWLFSIEKSDEIKSQEEIEKLETPETKTITYDEE